MLRSWIKANKHGPLLLQNCVYLVVFMVLITFVTNAPPGLDAWRFYGTLLSLAALLLVNMFSTLPTPPVSIKYEKTRDWIFLILSAGLILAMIWLSSLYDAAYLLSVLCIQAGFKRGVWPAGVVFGVVNLAAWGILLLGMGLPFSTLAIVMRSLIPGILFALLLTIVLERNARQTKRAEALLKELQAANQALETARQRETALAVAEERLRLGRDIHDGLGHHLTVLSIQLQAASKLVERNPQAAAEAIQVCRNETQAALEEVRTSVGAMRQNPFEGQPLVDRLAALVQDFDRHSGIRASFTYSGEPVEVPIPTRETFFRVAQEGLTNIQKHAQNAHQAMLRLIFEPNSLHLFINDDGQNMGKNETAQQPGYGLQGLRERVAWLGGSFRSAPAPGGGFEIEVCVPINGGKNDQCASG